MVDGPTLEASTVWHGPMEIGLPRANLITLETTWDQRLLGTTPGLLTVLYVPLFPVMSDADKQGSGDNLGLEYVPMLWGPHQLGDWHSLQNSWPSAVKSALFFNEPNESGQANISPQDSVGYWMNDYLPVRQKGIRLGGAATTSAPSGLQWVLDFERICVEWGNSAADCRNEYVYFCLSSRLC